MKNTEHTFPGKAETALYQRPQHLHISDALSKKRAFKTSRKYI